ncbi:nuclear pore complex protein Nup153 isoform X2 [Anabrus simplex]|uniref:nuclear pore complex protein Nup153 isoform X2 n=1 Tax=Anabrus simplex TaxID=316456 RepID=UPI0035A3242D
MAKGSSSLRNNKTRSSKPYDASNSFVKKVTSQVTNLLPHSEWFSRWFPIRASQQSIESDDDDDDDGIVDTPQPPPSKRAKISLNRTFPVNSFRVADEAQLRERRPQFESPSPVRHAYPDAVAGPSGLSTSARYSTSSNLQSTMVTENLENKLNDGGSDSSESTSGCSSLVPQASKQSQSETLAARRRTIDEKLNLTNHLQSPRSLFPNRIRTPRLVPPPSRRRPSFNASVFGSPLLESDRLPSKDLSPFYTGRTMYGGASAYRRPRENSFVNELNVSKRGIQVRPVNETKNSPEASMSHTARRILEALEQFSTPVQDAKRMPLNSPLYRPPLGSKRKCVESEARPPPPPPPLPLLPRVGPPTQSLTVPTVADLIKLRCKEKLQDSMESARRIASSSMEPYSLRLSEERKGSRHLGKMMKSSHIEYEASDVNLPEVSLPITTMPKFDIIVPPVSTAASSVESNIFKFSPPITVTSALPNVTAQGKFIFSAPLNKGIGQAVVTQNFLPLCPSLLESVDSFKNKPKIVGKGLVPKSKGQSNSVGFDIKPASELKTGSVMDFFAQQKKEESGKDKNSVSASEGFGEAFKPASGTWECDACMIRNKADATVCLACETPRQAKAALLAKPSSTWTCSSCFVPNKDSDAACVCCTNPKPGTVPEKKSAAEPTGSSWNCEACGAVNSCSSITCSECWCSKPKILSKPPKTSSQSVVAENKSTWTCSYCMTCNGDENVNCSSCKKTKLVSKTSSSKIKFNFEIPAEASTFKFGVDKSVDPPTTVNNLGGFKFGETAVTASPVNFTFGVPSSIAQSSDKQKDVTVTSASSSFAAVLAKGSQDGNTSKVGGFNFGTNQNQSSEVSNSSSGIRKRGSDSIDDANVKVPAPGAGEGPKRKADVAESVVNEIKSAQKRKAESAESVVNEVKSEQNEKPSTGLSKPFIINTNTNVSKPTTIPSIFSTAVSSSSLGAGTPANTKTASSGGFSFVSSSTSVDKSITTTASMPTSAPSFVFGSGASKTTDSSVSKKQVSINSATVTTATVVPSFGSCVTSSAGFGSTANTVSSGNATSSTMTFGTTSPKPVFGTAATTTTTTTPSFSTPTPTAKTSFTPPITTTPSFGVPDTTTPAFGTSVTKPNSATTTSATLTFGGSTVPSAAPLFGAAPATTAPSFGVSPATSSPSISSSSTTAASFGTTATTALTFNATSVTTASPFGTTPATTATGFGSSSTATPIFGSSPAVTVPSFGATPATTASGFGVTPATTVPAFGSASATVTPAFGASSGTSSAFGATPTPSFGVTTASTAPSFGNASTTSTPAFGTTTSSFGSPAAKPGSFDSAAPVPSFGIPSTKTPAFGTTPVTHSFGTPTATPTFGNSAVNAVNFNTTGTSAFGTPITTSTVGFGTPTITPSFGTPKTETNFAVPATTAPVFGTPTTTPSFGSGFGNSSTPFGGFSAGAAKGGASSSTPGTFVFKGNATPSIFGGSQTSSNNAECPPSKIPNFGFGTANTGSSTNASAAAPSFGSFNFSAGSGTAPSVFGASAGGANATSGSVFGTGTTPAFGTSGGSSGFGSGGFNFTAGSSTGSQPFAFNNPQSNQNNTPAFGQVQQPQPAPPTFNPNVRPTFDFTGGETPQFTAQPQSSAPLVTTSRRIKKAVRRTVR